MPAHQEGLAVTVAITVAAAAVVLGVLVALLGPVGEPRRSAGPGPTCQEWTDSCVICARTPEGLACSTPGIACVRGPIQCLKP